MQIKDFNVGDWFFSYEGELVILMEKDPSKNWCSVSTGLVRGYMSIDTPAYPLTLHNKVIADGIRWYHDKMIKANVLDFETRNTLNDYLYHLMMLNPDNTTKEEYQEIWNEIDNYYKSLIN